MLLDVSTSLVDDMAMHSVPKPFDANFENMFFVSMDCGTSKIWGSQSGVCPVSRNPSVFVGRTMRRVVTDHNAAGAVSSGT
jgi:hypothetical protein